MTCDDVERLLHAFVDTELPPPMLLAVARHAGSCLACDDAIRELTGLREAVVGSVESSVDDLDLSGVWNAVSTAIDRHDRHAARETSRASAAWRVPALALAATVLLAVGIQVWRTGRTGVAPGTSGPLAATRRTERAEPAARAPLPNPGRALVRAQRPPNYAAFDRLWGRGIEVKREPKSGTTVVLVNHVEGRGE